MNPAGLKANETIQSRLPSTSFASSWKQTLLLGLLLVAATVALYSRVNHFPFVNYDDGEYITNNIHVQTGLDWDTVRWAFTTYAAANWHPLTWLSHALDCQLFDLSPGGPHDVNLLLHVLNVLLLFLLLQRTRSETSMQRVYRAAKSTRLAPTLRRPSATAEQHL